MAVDADGDKKLFIKLNYPEEIGEVQDTDVDTFLGQVQDVS